MEIHKNLADLGEHFVIPASEKIIKEVCSPSPVGQAAEILAGLALITFSGGNPVVIGIGLAFTANGLVNKRQ